MVKKFSLKQILILFSTLLLLSSSLILVSCNSGSDSYSDPTSSYLEDADTLIEVEDLNRWYENGMKTDEGDPVLVVEMQPKDYDNDSKYDFIPGSVVRSFLDLQETRSDGPVNNTSMIASGNKMDSIISNLGITEDTVIVFTGQPGPTAYQITRAWWTFYYWGFPESKIKVLDGGTRAWYNAGYPTTNSQKIVTPSGFKISDLPYPEARVKRVDEARVPIGKMIDYAKNGGAIILATVPGTGQGFFDGKIKGSHRVDGINFFEDNGTFKKAEDIIEAFEGKGVTLPEDKNARIVVYCYRANLGSLYYYVLKGILGYKNVGNYDGAWSEWSGLFYNSETGLGTVISGSKYNALALTDEAVLRHVKDYDADNITAINNYIYTNNLDSSYDGAGNEINKEDKDYILNGGAGGLPGEAIGGGGSMGGC